MDLDFGNGLFCRVIAGFVFGKPPERNAQVSGVCASYPAAEHYAAREHYHCGDEGTEQVEHDDGGDPDCNEELAFDSHVRQWSVEAFVTRFLRRSSIRGVGGTRLAAPEPGQDVHRKRGNPDSDGDTGKILLRARLACRKADPAEDDRDDAGDLGYGSSEERLQVIEPGIKRRGVSLERVEDGDSSQHQRVRDAAPAQRCANRNAKDGARDTGPGAAH
jgi:hypothetical protein